MAFSVRVVNKRRVMKRLEQRAQELLKDHEKHIAPLAVQDLKSVTPVDTGRAKRGWRVEHSLLDDGTAIVNDVEYINYLNRGSSQKAPAYFVEQTLQKYGKI